MPQGLEKRVPEMPGKRGISESTSVARYALSVTIVFSLVTILYMLAAGNFFPSPIDEPASGSIVGSPQFTLFIVITGALVFLAAWSLALDLVFAKRKQHDSERELVMRLGQAAEWRDDETGDHALRVGEYCAAIASCLGWSGNELERIKVAAMLHDIGKIGIPDFVMVKEGELTPEERELIHAHTLMGSDILADSSVPLIQMAQRIAASHHERWDGAGYPYGLAKEHIPIEGRITALADVFDALTSKRRYKDAWSFDNTVVEIRTLSGTHFDPAVVEAFERALPEMKAIYDKYTSTARLFNISRAA